MIQFAHGLVARSDLPIPEWLFGWAAAMVLVVSFVALAVLWPEPKLQRDSWRPLPGGIGRVLASRPVEIVCGAIGVLLLGFTIYAGLRGTQSSTANFAPIFIYVIFWLGLVVASVLLGDVFKAFNPWRAIGRSVAGVARLFARGELPAPLPYPERLGRWPAAAGIFCFAVIELVASNGDKPENLAIATLVYSALTFIAMALYGVDRWIERGEAFSVYFNLFSRLAVFEARDGQVGVRKPLSGLAALSELPGTVGLRGRDDRLHDVRRRVREAALDRHLTRHRQRLPGHRALAAELARADLPARTDRDDPADRGLLPARHPRSEERGRRLQRAAASRGRSSTRSSRSRSRTWRRTT